MITRFARGVKCGVFDLRSKLPRFASELPANIEFNANAPKPPAKRSNASRRVNAGGA